MPAKNNRNDNVCPLCDDTVIAWDDPQNPCDCPCHDRNEEFEHPADPRFWILDYYPSDHYEDLKKSAINGELTCIVDEKAGGIVAYVIHKAISPEAVIEALEKASRVGP